MAQIQFVDEELEEAKALEEAEKAKEEEAKKQQATAELVLPVAKPDGPPEWAVIPDALKVPKGRQLIFIRFPAKWTDTPERGIEIGGFEGLWRFCICWVCSANDKRIAVERARSNKSVPDEMCKQMIRSVDGLVADWTGKSTPGSVEKWYNEIGEKCRNELFRVFLKLHQLDEGERKTFFESCIEVRTAG